MTDDWVSLPKRVFVVTLIKTTTHCFCGNVRHDSTSVVLPVMEFSGVRDRTSLRVSRAGKIATFAAACRTPESMTEPRCGDPLAAAARFAASSDRGLDDYPIDPSVLRGQDFACSESSAKLHLCMDCLVACSTCAAVNHLVVLRCVCPMWL